MHTRPTTVRFLTTFFVAALLLVPAAVPAGESLVSMAAVYPNPFTTFTVFQLSMPKEGDIRISVYDMLGGRIRTLYEGNHPAGEYNIKWDGNDETGTPVRPGIYLCVLFADNVALKSVKVVKVRGS